MSSHSRYASWLVDQGRPVVQAGGVDWTIYRQALVPADPTTGFVDIRIDDAAALVRNQGVRLVRWSKGPLDEPSEWWLVSCDSYALSELSSNTRSKINRGLRRNTVRQVSASWLATHGYQSYRLAFERYRGARALSETAFMAETAAMAEGPFEIWAVFSGSELGGYLVAVVEEGRVATSSVTVSPAALKAYASYALNATVLSEYVCERGMIVTNGGRAVVHQTEMQDFLLRLGFTRTYGSLQIVYSPWGRVLATAALALGPIVGTLPGRVPSLVRGLGFQESIRRKTALQGGSH